MNDVNFSSMTAAQLLAFYNRHAAQPLKRFSDRKTAEKRCAELFKSLRSPSPVKVMNQQAPASAAGSAGVRPAMAASLKLDRTIRCVDTKETWPNAYRMWVAHPEWLTSSQVDRLTAQLYAAAKAGERRQLEINGRTYELVNVGKAGK